MPTNTKHAIQLSVPLKVSGKAAHLGTPQKEKSSSQTAVPNPPPARKTKAAKNVQMVSSGLPLCLQLAYQM